MIKILKQIFKVGTITEPLAKSETFEVLGHELKTAIRKRFQGSLTIRMVDAGSCNGCELEIHAANNAYYDIEQYGVQFTASPRFADMLLVTGPVSINMKTALEMTYDAMPAPKLVVAMGECAINCGVFGKDNYAVAGAVSDIIPVNTIIHGCPPTPTDLIRGILTTLKEI
ncbi:MAG: NADH-quinone oxidoreductase subunit NuoB [Ghiorsea sp.]